MIADESLLVVGPPAGSPEPLEQLLDHARTLAHRRLVFLGGYLAEGGENETVVQMLRLTPGLHLAGAAELGLVRRWRQASRPSEALSWLDLYGLSAESIDWLASLAPAPGPVPLAWAARFGGPLAGEGPLTAVLLPEGELWRSTRLRWHRSAFGSVGPGALLAEELVEEL